MGSKPSLAAGIDSGVITENTTYDDKGFRIIKHKAHCQLRWQARGGADARNFESVSQHGNNVCDGSPR